VLSRFRERLVLVLLVLLPFHALGVTVFTRAIVGVNKPPMGVLALWKEALLASILLIAFVEIIRGDRKRAWRLDRFDWCIAVLATALAAASFLADTSFRQAMYGVRYDLVPLAAFVILRRVPWSDSFSRRLPTVFAVSVSVAAAYGLLTLFLPASFFSVLGYSDLHSLYIPDGPIAAFQQIGGTSVRRIQGAMSGPNQFGIWISMLLPVALAGGWRARRVLAPLMLLAIVLSLSRAAWIAAAVIVALSLWPQVKKASIATIAIACVAIFAAVTALIVVVPSIVVRLESSADHLRNPLEALSIMVASPLGRGLGSAGPASNRVADACVFLEEGSDPSWAAAHPGLCVFVGDAQVQPADACTCPLLPENWYLQLGVEGGWVAMAAFITLIALVIRRLWPAPSAMGLLAVAIAGMFLHAWEDAAVAYTVWILCAVAMVSDACQRAE